MIDRTNELGLGVSVKQFADVARRLQPVETRTSRELTRIVRDQSLEPIMRDHAVWVLVYRGETKAAGLVHGVSQTATDQRFRRSAAYALFKMEAFDAVRTLHSPSDHPNTTAFKTHLINESIGSSEPFDNRPYKYDPAAAFDFTMPIFPEGIVEFWHDGQGYYIPIGQIVRMSMLGELTAGIRALSFETDLVIQKRISNLRNSGVDHIEGYLFKGRTAALGVDSYLHRYECLSRHKVYRSGVVGDESKGVIDDASAILMRFAQTDVHRRTDTAFPVPQSVRGTFFGHVYVNPIVLNWPQPSFDPARELSGTLQIVSPADPNAGELVNGLYYGSFRGIPMDIANSGQLQINGIPTFVGHNGAVHNRTPTFQPLLNI